MPSRADRSPRRWWAGVLLTAVLLAASDAAGQPEPTAAAAAGMPTTDEVTRALERLRSDPDFAPARQVHTLRWSRPNAADRQRSGLAGWFDWLRGLGRWMDQSARYLIWVSVGLAAVLLGMSLVRLLGGRAPAAGDDPFVAPTHVGCLDIRPEALPRDVGAAARDLWDRREQRAALALLYRGLLSRLAHVHRMPVRDSSTEGDCIAMAAARLPAAMHDYAARLVAVWQHSVYGQEPAADALVHRLCDEFGPTLDRPVPGDAVRQRDAP